MKTVAIIARKSSKASKLREQIVKHLNERKLTIYVAESRLAKTLPVQILPEDKLADKADLAIVIGGDGTLLRAAQILGGKDIPVLGINAGTLGFLTEIQAKEIPGCLDEVLEGRFHTTERRMLKAEIYRSGKRFHAQRVLNDVVINKSSNSPIVRLEAHMDGELVTAYRGDGLIISTPTGSTAYNMAAGGPVLYPTLQVFTLTPICPHTFANRPVVIPDSSNLVVKVVESKGEVYCSMDGRAAFPMEKGDEVHVRRARRVIRLIRSPKRDYFNVLRTKLNWNK